MRVNLYTSFNGVGLEKDHNIVKDILEKAGHKVGTANYLKRNIRPPYADVAIHMEIPRPELMSLSKVNIMKPNPEWFEQKWLPLLRRFDCVMAKTKDCERIFKIYHKNVVFTSFTSLDFHDKAISKDKQLLHVQGKSQLKGTNEILRAYGKHDLPRLFMLSKHNHTGGRNIVHGGFLSDRDFRILLNSCLIHLCPSYYEGFGHYIWEAMSTGAVVITTDAAPMNSFITDDRFLVRRAARQVHHMGVLNYPDAEHLAAIIKRVDEMGFGELEKIGQENREQFLKNDKYFKKNLLKLINV